MLAGKYPETHRWRLLVPSGHSPGDSGAGPHDRWSETLAAADPRVAGRGGIERAWPVLNGLHGQGEWVLAHDAARPCPPTAIRPAHRHRHGGRRRHPRQPSARYHEAHRCRRQHPRHRRARTALACPDAPRCSPPAPGNGRWRRGWRWGPITDEASAMGARRFYRQDGGGAADNIKVTRPGRSPPPSLFTTIERAESRRDLIDPQRAWYDPFGTWS